MKWLKKRRLRAEQRAEAQALLHLFWTLDNLRLKPHPRYADPWYEFRHGPVDKAAIRGPIAPSANSIRELHLEDLRARRGCCCRCGR